MIQSTKCDILVIGAGPAGSFAAKTAAEKGARVIIIERKAQVGLPVRCAEYIPGQLPGMIGLGREYVVQAIKGMRTFLPDGDVTNLKAPGFTIHRHVFDKTLAKAAINAGAQFYVSTSAVAFDQGAVVVKTGVDNHRISANVIIGADGPFSTVGKWVGCENKALIPAVQVSVMLTKPLEMTEVYFHEDIYAGYGWLFPKGKEANVGLGAKTAGKKRNVLNGLLGQFVNRLADEGKVYSKILNLTGGWIPATPVRNVVKDNILLVGDAAGQTHPITGAGISPAVICGEMAGRWAAEAVSSNDRFALFEYQKEWEDLFGETNNRASMRRRLMENQWHQLDAVIKKCWVCFREYYTGN